MTGQWGSVNGLLTSIDLLTLTLTTLCELTLTPACADLLTRILDSRAQRNARIAELGLVQAFCEPGMNVEKLKADLEERVQLTVKFVSAAPEHVHRYADLLVLQISAFVADAESR